MEIQSVPSISVEGLLQSKSYGKMIKNDKNLAKLKISESTLEKMKLLQLETKIATSSNSNPYAEDVTTAAKKVTVKETADYRNAHKDEILNSLNFLEIVCFHAAQDQTIKTSAKKEGGLTETTITNKEVDSTLYLAIKDIEKLKRSLVKEKVLRGDSKRRTMIHSKLVKNEANQIVRDALRLVSPKIRKQYNKEIQAAYKTLYRNMQNYKLKF